MSATPYMLDFPTFEDERGSLTVAEGANLPFAIRRIYYMYNVPQNMERGVHGHRTLRQLMICMAGSTLVTLHDGERERSFALDRPNKALYVPAMMWRVVDFRQPDSVCLVLASAPYEKSDYIFDFDEFLAEASKRRRPER